MAKHKKQQQPELTATDEELASFFPWMRDQKPDADGNYCVWALVEVAGPNKPGRKVLIAKCPSLDMARLIISHRQVSDAATNLVGRIKGAVDAVSKSGEAQKYQDAWRRSGLPYDECIEVEFLGEYYFFE